MSLAALLQAVRDEIRENLPGINNASCKVSVDAQPDATIGKRFIAIYPTVWRPTGGEVCMGIAEEYGLAVGITFMAGDIPADRTEDLYLRILWGMESTARKIAALVHQSYEVQARADQIIKDRAALEGNPAPANLMTEPLRWLGTDTSPQPKYGDWIYSKETDKICAYLLNVYFGQASRYQSKENLV